MCINSEIIKNESYPGKSFLLKHRMMQTIQYQYILFNI